MSKQLIHTDEYVHIHLIGSEKQSHYLLGKFQILFVQVILVNHKADANIFIYFKLTIEFKQFYM